MGRGSAEQVVNETKPTYSGYGQCLLLALFGASAQIVLISVDGGANGATPDI